MSYRDKIGSLHLQLGTLFLDTDLELLSPIDDIFQILRTVDLVIVKFRAMERLEKC